MQKKKTLPSRMQKKKKKTLPSRMQKRKKKKNFTK